MIMSRCRRGPNAVAIAFGAGLIVASIFECECVVMIAAITIIIIALSCGRR